MKILTNSSLKVGDQTSRNLQDELLSWTGDGVIRVATGFFGYSDSGSDIGPRRVITRWLEQGNELRTLRSIVGIPSNMRLLRTY